MVRFTYLMAVMIQGLFNMQASEQTIFGCFHKNSSEQSTGKYFANSLSAHRCSSFCDEQLKTNATSFGLRKSICYCYKSLYLLDQKYRIESKRCESECATFETKYCGDEDAIAVYFVSNSFNGNSTKCHQPPVLRGGYFRLEGPIVYFQCEDGFILFGDEKLVCSNAGVSWEWYGTMPRCERIVVNTSESNSTVTLSVDVATEKYFSKVGIIISVLVFLALMAAAAVTLDIIIDRRKQKLQLSQSSLPRLSINIFDRNSLSSEHSSTSANNGNDLEDENVVEEDKTTEDENRLKYYSTADLLEVKDPRMVNEKDVTIVMNIKMGKIYKRWMGSVNLSNASNKCVVVTTLADRVMNKKGIHWQHFLTKCLELPASDHVVKIEAVSIQSSKPYLISETLVCENMRDVLTGDTKDKGDYYSCCLLHVSDVISYLAGVMEGMEVLQTFGFLHPGLTSRKILLTKGGLVKLYDFCLADDAIKMVEMKKPQVDPVTLNHFPPEALAGKKYTELSDVWSTAVVMWEIMIGGKVPFENEPDLKVDAEVSIPSEPWPEKYIHIQDKILFECWHHDPTLRPSIHHLREKFMSIFSRTVTENSYDMPLHTLHRPITAPNKGAEYKGHIYHAGNL